MKHIQPKTSTGRKVLLILDAYRAHISPPVPQLLRRNNVYAYALPAHTFGKTQPLDLVPFASFKNELKKILQASLSSCVTTRRSNFLTFVRSSNLHFIVHSVRQMLWL